MTLLANHRSRYYNGLIGFLLLLVPVCNAGAIRYGFYSLFHNEAELALFLLYTAPLWVGFSLFIVIELYRQAVMKMTPGNNLVAIMIVGGFIFSSIGILLCPVGPQLISLAALELALSNSIICGVLGLCVRYLLKLRQFGQGQIPSQK